MASPTNSDNNSYGSPALSPGSWNVPSPDADQANWNVSSPQSYNSNSSGSSRSSRSGAPPATSSSVSSSGSTTTHDFIGLPLNLGKPNAIPKTKHDVKRQRRSELKAQDLLRDNWGNQSTGSERTPAPTTVSHSDPEDGGYALRMQAIREYKEKKRLAKIEAFKKGETPKSVGPPRVLRQTPKERLATTTRKKKVASPEEDYETINDYKSTLDIEREREAKQTALDLLKKFGY